MSTITLPQETVSTSSASDSWLLSSVQTFFSEFNWEDTPPDIQAIKQAFSVEGNSGPLSFALSVSQFFAAINWDGSEIAAPIPVEPSSLAQYAVNNDLTLDQFSSLF